MCLKCLCKVRMYMVLYIPLLTAIFVLLIENISVKTLKYHEEGPKPNLVIVLLLLH